MCFVCSDLSKGTANNRFYLVVFWLFWSFVSFHPEGGFTLFWSFHHPYIYKCVDNVLFVVWYALFRLCLVVIHIYIYLCVEVVSLA